MRNRVLWELLPKGGIIVTFVLAGFASLASSSDGTPMAAGEEGPKKVTIARDSAGKVVRASVGTEIEVSLDGETTSAGYQWIPEKGYEEVLRLVRSEIREPSEADNRGKPPASGEVMGGSKKRVLTFDVHSAGTTKLVILLRRDWESPDRSVDRVEFTIEAAEPRS